MKGLNKVTLIGHLGRKPEVRKVKEDLSVSHVAIATTEMYRDVNGKVQSQTDWHNLVLWGKLSAIAEKYLDKGNLVYIEGRLKNRSYQDKSGCRKMVSEVIVEQILMLK